MKNTCTLYIYNGYLNNISCCLSRYVFLIASLTPLCFSILFLPTCITSFFGVQFGRPGYPSTRNRLRVHVYETFCQIASNRSPAVPLRTSTTVFSETADSVLPKRTSSRTTTEVWSKSPCKGGLQIS